MARIFRPEYTRPLKPGTKTRTRKGVTEAELTIRGRGTGWYEVREVKGVPRVVVPTEEWYLEYPDPVRPGETARERAFKDKTASEALLLRKLTDSERQRAGLTSPGDGDAGRPLEHLLAEYLAVLRAKDCGAGHVRNVERHVSAAIAGAKWSTFRKITADSLSLHLGRLRDAPRRSGSRVGGTANTTLNTVIRDCKAFVAWLSRRLKAFNPLDGFEGFNPKVGLRRSRHTLTDPEFDSLCAAAERGGAVRRTPGPERALIYRVAAYTGFRASEVALLTPAHFRLDATPPTVNLDAGEDKADRGADQPLPAWLAGRLRAWLAGRDPNSPIFPGDWAEKRRQRHWLTADLKAAGLPRNDPTGRPITFHNLRRRYISAVVRSGADVKQVQKLARHSAASLTLDVYAETDPAGLGAVVDRLPGGR